MTETAVPNVLKSEVLARFVVETPSEAVPDAMVKKLSLIHISRRGEGRKVVGRIRSFLSPSLRTGG